MPHGLATGISNNMHGLRKKPQAGQLLICRDGRTLEVGSLLPSGFASGDLVYGAGASSLSRLAIGAANTVLTSDGSVPQWSTSLSLSSLTVGSLMEIRAASDTDAATSTTSVRILRSSGNAGADIFPSSAGHLILMPRTSVARHVSIWTGTPSASERLRVDSGGVVTVFATTASTSTTTGSLVVSGGQGIGGQITGGAAILSVSGTAGIGYGTGAGGTVTQITSKSTGVTINKVCGQITMHNAALAAGAVVSFVVTNSACTATDVPDVCVASGGTANAYRADVTAVASGSFTITVENLTAGSLSEAPVLTFSLGKAVTA